MFGILGSGFGLYGYLPAVVGLGLTPVLLPERYRVKFLARDELKILEAHIHWIGSDQALLESVTTLIISKRPADQYVAFPDYLARRQIKKIVLEKPLAPNPTAALEMLEHVKASGKQCCAGFTFRFTSWAAPLQYRLVNSANLSKEVWELKWHFMAHHYSNNLLNWKRQNLQGGGALRYFGIHVIALLAEWGYCHVVSSEVVSELDGGGYSSWRAIFRGMDLPEFRIEIDSRSTSTYFILQNKNDSEPFQECRGPFDSPTDRVLPEGMDQRYIYLQKVLTEVIAPDEPWPRRLLDATNLWSQVEGCTKIL
ncbi:MAG: hypothetical protein EBY22_07490 [Gammaproteobacteria bacterium]|nr:hypothetical protein [Gammaproteobacteria bacterium]